MSWHSIFYLCYIVHMHTESNCCLRQYCGPSRPFAMAITDNSGAEVIHLERPMRCNGACCFCCLQEIEVQSPPGTIIGYVKQKWETSWVKLFTVLLFVVVLYGYQSLPSKMRMAILCFWLKGHVVLVSFVLTLSFRYCTSKQLNPYLVG